MEESYRSLQARAKTLGISANQKATVLRALLAAESSSSATTAATTTTTPPTPSTASFAAALDDFAPTAKLRNNFLKGFSFSPDGSCVLTNSEDAVLRVYETPHAAAAAAAPETTPRSSLRAAVWAREGETIFDARWYPLMDASTPASCVFASTSRDHPIHMWDAYTGALRASYLGYDHYDALTTAVSVAFSPRGQILIGGYERAVRVWDLTRPGRSTETRATRKRRRRAHGQCGLLGALAFSAAYPVYCAGSYLGGASIYAEDTGELVCHLAGGPEHSGVTQVQFAAEGSLLFAGLRRDNRVLCWDTRRPDLPLLTLTRPGATNMRLGFDVDARGTQLVTGTSEAHALLYSDLRLGADKEGAGGGEEEEGAGAGRVEGMETARRIEGANEAVVHCARFGVYDVVAYSTGGRIAEANAEADDSSDDDDDEEEEEALETAAAASPSSAPAPAPAPPANGLYFTRVSSKE